MKTDLFEQQDEDFENLPDATEQLRFLAPAVVEVLAGVRTVEQLSPMLSESIYLKLRDRAARAARNRSESNGEIQRPNFVVSNLHQESHRPGVIQSVVLLTSNLRTRAVAIRLESRNRRWLATAVSIL
ncbi:MAG: 3-hydroxyacyl-CoA dehydrogenase [Microbacteriaceae bacterium]|nr:3-hydroxyacyl-CoA dehydrogenase [Microbacteriaceae bacterium]